MHAHGVGAGLGAAPDDARVELSETGPPQLPVEPSFGPATRGARGAGAGRRHVGELEVLPGDEARPAHDGHRGVPLEAVVLPGDAASQPLRLGEQAGPLPGAASAPGPGSHQESLGPFRELGRVGTVEVFPGGCCHRMANAVIKADHRTMPQALRHLVPRLHVERVPALVERGIGPCDLDHLARPHVDLVADLVGCV